MDRGDHGGAAPGVLPLTTQMDQLTLPHLHLLLNHFPTVGAVMGLALLLLALARRSRRSKRS